MQVISRLPRQTSFRAPANDTFWAKPARQRCPYPVLVARYSARRFARRSGPLNCLSQPRELPRPVEAGWFVRCKNRHKYCGSNGPSRLGVFPFFPRHLRRHDHGEDTTHIMIPRAAWQEHTAFPVEVMFMNRSIKG